jgi:AraC-like DNA-binding protein
MVAPAATAPAPAGPETHLHRPGPELSPYVTDATGYRLGATAPGTHQGVPSGHLTFLLCLDGSVELLRMPDPARSPGSFVALVGGLHDAPAVIRQGEPQTGIQVRLTWRGARALLGVPAGALAGDVVDLAALLGRRTGPLLDRLASAPAWPERFALLDRTLADLVRSGPGERGVLPEVGYAWDRLAETGGNLRIGDLAREVGWSRRHLAGRFRRETGLGLKTAARVIRFERACDRLRRTDRPPLARVAAECGYADQAHLSRDFRELTGVTATRWLTECLVEEPAGRPDLPAGTAGDPARR